MSQYHDYRFRFRTEDLPLALQAFDSLRQRGLMASDTPMNQLGWTQGRAEQTVTDPDGNAVTIPAAGDPAYYYVNIRTRNVAPEDLAGLDFGQFGLEPLDTPELQAEGEAVLGVWA